jgi:succinoglycan biosynthesis protein ExoA
MTNHLSSIRDELESPDSQDGLPFISIVMPVRNESASIGITLEQILSQDYSPKRYEIIVADGMSDDETASIVKQFSYAYPQIKYIMNAGRLPSSGRNIGFKSGQGDYFVVVDGHSYLPDNQYLKNIVKSFEKSGAGCLGRAQPLDPPGLTRFQNAVAMARASRLGHSGDSLIFAKKEGFVSPVSNGFAYKKEIFQRIGFVDEGFDACEDVEFNYRLERAGVQCYMSPLLLVKYYPRKNIRDLFRQMSRYGQGRFKFIRKHFEALDFNQLIPAFFISGLVLLLALGLINWIKMSVRATPYVTPVFYLLSIIYGLYLCMLIIESLRLAVKNRLYSFYYLPVIFLTIHLGLGWGFLAGGMKIFFRATPLEKN